LIVYDENLSVDWQYTHAVLQLLFVAFRSSSLLSLYVSACVAL